MKYSILIFLFACLSCTGMLEQVPLDAPTSNEFLQNEDDAILAVNASYAAWTNGTSGTPLYARTFVGLELMSDNAWTASSNTDGVYGKWENFSYDINDDGILETYKALYACIARSNIVLEKVPDIVFSNDPDSGRKNALLGQAYFLRGYAYFLLELLWGEVPIVLEPVYEPLGVSIEKSSCEMVYQQAMDDMLEAEKLLPSVFMNSEDAGRVTKWAAKGMLAKMYLFGADELKKTDWYARSAEKAKEVIDSGLYGLFKEQGSPEENFKYVFSIPAQNGKEHLFSIQHQSAGGWGNPQGTELVMSINPRQDKKLVFGYGHCYIHPELGNPVYWEANDARREVSLWQNGDHGEAATHPGTDESKVFDMTKQLVMHKVRQDGYGVKKYYWGESLIVNPNSNLNWPVLRFADVLLIYAEAKLMSGTMDQTALDAYNQVRDRAGLEKKRSMTREDILTERRKEFIGEFHRWFDLMRTRTAEGNFANLKYKVDKGAFVAEKHYKFPLPMRALQLNSSLVQNPAWGSN